MIATAESLIRDNATELSGRPVENLSPGELDRWLADCREASHRQPVVLTLHAAPVREVADEPTWPFDFTMSAAEKAGVGYPVSWLTAPGKPYPQADAAALARRIETGFADGRFPTSRHILFRYDPTQKSPDERGTGRLSTALFYRGHIYENTTDVVLLGAPTREVIYTPPQGPAAFGIRTERNAVAGVVTILIDLSASMNDPLVENDKNGKRRLTEAKEGLKQVLRQLPSGTTVTLAPFYGDQARSTLTLEPSGQPRVMDGDNWEKAYEPFEKAKGVGLSTPIAGAITKVLSKTHEKQFWPRDATTGSRTLIVLTDGVGQLGADPGWSERLPGAEGTRPRGTGGAPGNAG